MWEGVYYPGSIQEVNSFLHLLELSLNISVHEAVHALEYVGYKVATNVQ